MKFSSRFDLDAKTDFLVNEQLKKKANLKVESKDVLMALPDAADPAAACAAVSGGLGLSACRDDILEDNDVCHVVVDDVDDEDEDDSPNEFVPMHLICVGTRN